LATATKEKNVLNGKVALVSGAASGIGAAIAQRIVDHGAKVVIGVEQQVSAARRSPPPSRGGGVVD
jgi:NAD(P)-dependent dehydrogenase (short-subunit alcohol dehydrogenase family)